MRHELVMRGLRLPFFLPGVHQPGQGNFSPAKGRKTGYVVPLASSPGRWPCLAPAGFQRLSALTGPEARRWGMTPGAAPVGAITTSEVQHQARPRPARAGQPGPLVPGLASQADHITTSEVRVWTKVILDRELSTILVDKPVDYLDF